MLGRGQVVTENIGLLTSAVNRNSNGKLGTVFVEGRIKAAEVLASNDYLWKQQKWKSKAVSIRKTRSALTYVFPLGIMDTRAKKENKTHQQRETVSQPLTVTKIDCIRTRSHSAFCLLWWLITPGCRKTWFNLVSASQRF